MKHLLCIYLAWGIYGDIVVVDVDDYYPDYPSDCIVVHSFEDEEADYQIKTYKPEPPEYVQEVIDNFTLDWTF